MPGNARIQSVFAKAILDVRYLDELAKKKEISAPGEEGSLLFPEEHIHSLRLFSAFIAKVQHNYLWNDFPLTLTTIRRLGIELEIFSAYLAQHQANRRNHLTLSLEEKKDRFVQFFKTFTSGKTDEAFIQAHAILTHEDIYRQAKKYAAENDDLAGRKSTRISMKSVPVFNGRIWIAALSVTPAAISTILQTHTAVKMFRRKKKYCYWRSNSTADISVFEVSKNVASVMQAIDGKKSIDQLNALTGYSAVESGRGQKEIIKTLASAGIISCI